MNNLERYGTSERYFVVVFGENNKIPLIKDLVEVKDPIDAINIVVDNMDDIQDKQYLANIKSRINIGIESNSVLCISDEYINKVNSLRRTIEKFMFSYANKSVFVSDEDAIRDDYFYIMRMSENSFELYLKSLCENNEEFKISFFEDNNEHVVTIDDIMINLPKKFSIGRFLYDEVLKFSFDELVLVEENINSMKQNILEDEYHLYQSKKVDNE